MFFVIGKAQTIFFPINGQFGDAIIHIWNGNIQQFRFTPIQINLRPVAAPYKIDCFFLACVFSVLEDDDFDDDDEAVAAVAPACPDAVLVSAFPAFAILWPDFST